MDATPGKTLDASPPRAVSQQTQLQRYGFVGIGVMGWGMANNLRAKLPPDATLVICEVNKDRLDQWLKQAPGPATVAATPKEVAEQSDVIFTMLPRGSHVWDVFTNKETGFLSATTEPSSNTQEKLFIECSTIDIDTSLRTARAVTDSATALGVKYDFIDAPVSGGVNGANAGTLSFMVGTEIPVLFDKVRPILSLMGKPENIFHCGLVSSGLATKQINNYLSCITMIGTCEAMNIGLRSGLDPVKLASVISVSTGACYNCTDQNPVRGVSANASSARDFAAGFTTEMAKGVLDMALEHGKKVGAKSLLGDVVSDFYELAAGHKKCQGKDFRSIWRLFAEDDGRDLYNE